MAQLQNTQTLALQLERVRDKLELLYERTDTLWGMIKEETDVDPVSTRNMRIPVQALAGGIPSQVDPDGGDFGRGSGTTFDFGQITPVYISIAVEVSKLAEIATNGGEKAIESIAKVEPANAMKQLNKVMDNLLNTDGSATLDTVVTVTSATQWIVNNGNQFMDNMLIDVWSALGGTFRGTVQVLSVDPNANVLYLAGAGLGTTISGDLLLLRGAPGVAGGSLLGILYYQTQSNSGNWLQLPRASYPGKLRTPYVNGNSASVTQQTFRRMLSQLAFALGDDIAEQQKGVWYMDLDQAAAWENVGLAVSQVIQNQLTGSSSEDMIKKATPQTAAGRKIVKSIHAKPGRIDFLCLSHWGRCENQPIDYLEYGGQTVFPIYGASGGVAGASIFYYWTGCNVFNANPRAGAYSDNLAIPVGYFGH
jgi:hypothetical protein